MATIDLGKIKLVNKNTWDTNTTYTADDIVQYTDTGNSILSTYICVVASSQGHTPSSSGTTHASWNFIAKGIADPVPSQSGESGKFLTTNGSAASWAALAGNTPAAFIHLTSDSGSTSSYVWYTIGGTSIGGVEDFDTDSAVTNGEFTVPSGEGGTYMAYIASAHTGSSTHSTSDGVYHRIQKYTGGAWETDPIKGCYKTHHMRFPGDSITGASSQHIAYNLAAGEKLRCQVWSYRNQGSSNMIWKAGRNDAGVDGTSGGTYCIIYRLF